MVKRRKPDYEEEEEDSEEDSILRDGQSVRVSLFMVPSTLS